ncbi:MAG: 4'-phosphopantetheinyl transferase family protein [Planctomycetota bacterium]
MSVLRLLLHGLIAIASPADASQSGVLDLWWFPYGEVEERSELFAAYAALLTQEEQARHERLRFERDKRQFLATRALVRTVLSFYSPDVAPTAWRFAIGDRGKPSISEPIAARGWQFNLSNTRGCVVCAVSGVHARLGVDVERLDRANDLLALADRYFSALEVAELRGLPHSEQSSRFFDYWTLKESYIKAHGLGLAIPLDSFSFLLGAHSQGRGPSPTANATIDETTTSSIGIEFDSRRDDVPDRWSFALIDGPPRFRVAVALETCGSRLTLRARRFIPLLSEP